MIKHKLSIRFVRLAINLFVTFSLIVVAIKYESQVRNQEKEIKELKDTIASHQEKIKNTAHLAYNNGRLIGIDVCRFGKNYDQSFARYWSSWSNTHKNAYQPFDFLREKK